MTQHQWIFEVVNSFYTKVRADVLISYHFWRIPDFDEHIPRIATFWDFQLLGKSERELTHPFDVMNLHLQMGIKKGELGRWLVLFRKTLEEETQKHPEMSELRANWEERLKVFEGIFSRFLGL